MIDRRHSRRRVYHAAAGVMGAAASVSLAAETMAAADISASKQSGHSTISHRAPDIQA